MLKCVFIKRIQFECISKIRRRVWNTLNPRDNNISRLVLLDDGVSLGIVDERFADQKIIVSFTSDIHIYYNEVATHVYSYSTDQSACLFFVYTMTCSFILSVVGKSICFDVYVRPSLQSLFFLIRNWCIHSLVPSVSVCFSL